MSRFNLRQRTRINYKEQDEPNLDEYVFCDYCGDYVFEYCSIHGPLLIVPDDGVPLKPGYPPYVPRAALTVPRMLLHLAPSIISGAGLGVFTTLTLPKGVRFGPYRGLRSDEINSMYCWQIHDGNNRRSHVVDAADGNRSNWMRYVNCARHSTEQNLIAFQYRGKLYYRTIKIIPRFTELFVFYGSEFAKFLNINLRTYNSELHYDQANGQILAEPKRQTLFTDTNYEENSPKDNKGMLDYGYPYTIGNDNAPQTQEIADDFLYLDDHKEQSVMIDTLSEAERNVTVVEMSAELTPICGDYDTQKDCFQIEFVQDFGTDNANIGTVTQSEKADTIKCPDCGFTTKHKKNLLRHRKNIHSANHRCNTCDQIGHDWTIRHEKNGGFQCPDCEFTTKLKKNLVRHRKNMHSANYKCHSCEQIFQSYAQLRKHRYIHTENMEAQAEQLQCAECEFTTKLKTSLVRHRKNIHSANYTCSVCAQTFQSYAQLRNHRYTHGNRNMPYCCSQCPYKTNRLSNLKDHQLRHTKAHIFKCKLCSYTGHVKRDLTKHVRTAHLKKN